MSNNIIKMTVYGVSEYELPEIEEGRAAAFLANHADALGYEPGDDEDDPVGYLEEGLIYTLGHGTRDAQGSSLLAVAKMIEEERGICLFCDCGGDDAGFCIGCCAAECFPWSRMDWGRLVGFSKQDFCDLLDKHLVELYGPKTWGYGEIEIIY